MKRWMITMVAATCLVLAAAPTRAAPPAPASPPQSTATSLLDAAKDTVKDAVTGELKKLASWTIDDWAQEQIDLPLSASRGFFHSTFLTQPSLLEPSERWVIKGWSLMLPFGFLLLLLAWMNHARHALKGTDLLHRRNPFVRLGIPGLCLIVMLMAPASWEFLRAGQQWIWAVDGFDRNNADAVLSVVLPPSQQLTATGQVILGPAGSIAPVRSRLGTTAGVGSGLVVLILGEIGFVAYLLGRFILIMAPIYLGLSAFSHRIEPALGWLDLGLRTNFLLSLFNLAWVVMRGLPTWMTWIGVDTVVFICLELPALLVAIYYFWMRRLGDMLRDPLMLGGADVLERTGRWASGVGRTLALASGALGTPALAAVGGQMTAWGTQTARAAGRARRAADAGDTGGTVRNLMQVRLPRINPKAFEPNDGRPTTCWYDGDQFVYYVRGIPTWSPTPPPGVQVAGPWKGDEA